MDCQGALDAKQGAIDSAYLWQSSRLKLEEWHRLLVELSTLPACNNVLPQSAIDWLQLKDITEFQTAHLTLSLVPGAQNRSDIHGISSETWHNMAEALSSQRGRYLATGSRVKILNIPKPAPDRRSQRSTTSRPVRHTTTACDISAMGDVMICPLDIWSCLNSSFEEVFSPTLQAHHNSIRMGKMCFLFYNIEEFPMSDDRSSAIAQAEERLRSFLCHHLGSEYHYYIYHASVREFLQGQRARTGQLLPGEHEQLVMQLFGSSVDPDSVDWSAVSPRRSLNRFIEESNYPQVEDALRERASHFIARRQDEIAQRFDTLSLFPLAIDDQVLSLSEADAERYYKVLQESSSSPIIRERIRDSQQALKETVEHVLNLLHQELRNVIQESGSVVDSMRLQTKLDYIITMAQATILTASERHLTVLRDDLALFQSETFRCLHRKLSPEELLPLETSLRQAKILTAPYRPMVDISSNALQKSLSDGELLSADGLAQNLVNELRHSHLSRLEQFGRSPSEIVIKNELIHGKHNLLLAKIHLVTRHHPRSELQSLIDVQQVLYSNLTSSGGPMHSVLSTLLPLGVGLIYLSLLPIISLGLDVPHHLALAMLSEFRSNEAKCVGWLTFAMRLQWQGPLSLQELNAIKRSLPIGNRLLNVFTSLTKEQLLNNLCSALLRGLPLCSQLQSTAPEAYSRVIEWCGRPKTLVTGTWLHDAELDGLVPPETAEVLTGETTVTLEIQELISHGDLVFKPIQFNNSMGHVAPGTDFMVNKLTQLVAGRCTTPSRLISLSQGNERKVLLASEKVEGVNFQQILEQCPSWIDRLDHARSCDLTLASLLFCPRAGQASSYTVEFEYGVNEENNRQTFRLFLVQTRNDMAFAYPRESGGNFEARSVLFLLPFMDQPFAVSTRVRFLDLQPDLVLLEWLSAIDRQNKLYINMISRNLFTEGEEPPSQFLDLPMTIEAGLVNRIFDRMTKIQEVLTYRDNCTFHDIFAHVDPTLAWSYRNIRASDESILDKAAQVFPWDDEDEQTRQSQAFTFSLPVSDAVVELLSEIPAERIDELLEVDALRTVPLPDPTILMHHMLASRRLTPNFLKYLLGKKADVHQPSNLPGIPPLYPVQLAMQFPTPWIVPLVSDLIAAGSPTNRRVGRLTTREIMTRNIPDPQTRRRLARLCKL